MRRARFVPGIFAALAFIGLVGGGALPPATAWAAEKVQFQFDWVFYGKFAGYFAARDKGFYKAVGLDVTLDRGYGTAATSVAAGKHDYGIDGMSSVVIARSKNIPVKMVSVWHERGMYTLFMLKSSGIRTPKDLEGKTIGVAAGDVNHRSFAVFSKAVGLKKWEWVFLRPAAKNPSLLAKKVDAIGTFTTVGIPLRIQAKKMGDGIVEFLWSDFGVRLPTDGIVTHDKTIAEKPGQIRRFLSATLEGNAWAIEHPKEAVDIFQKSRPDARRSLTAAFWDLSSRFQVWGSLKEHGLGHFDRGVMEYTRKAIIEAYQLKNPPALDDIYTAEFLPKELPKPKLPKPAM